MTRFYIDHGVIHDRVTGKHVVTNGEPPFEDSVEQVCELLNSIDTCATEDEKKVQATRCGCRGHDEYCACQNVPDAVSWAERCRTAGLQRSAATSESASTLQALADRLRWISMQNLSLKLLDEVWRNLPDIVRGLDAAAAASRNDREGGVS